MARRRRRRSRGYLSPTRRVTSPLLSTPAARRGGGKRRGSFAAGRDPGRRRLLIGALMLVLVGGGVAAFATVRAGRAADERRVEAATAFTEAWGRGDLTAMWRLTGGDARPSLEEFKRSYGRAYQAAGVDRTAIGDLGELRDDAVRVPVTMRTDIFGELEGSVTLPTLDQDGRGRIAWDPALRLPGLRAGETPARTAGRTPRRGTVLASDGSPLADDPIGSGIAGTPPADGEPPTGLERIYDRRLAGRPAAVLRFDDRVVERVEAVRGRNVRSTIQLGLTRSAQTALGAKQAGVAVVRPSDGAVLALAGLAVSAPQPPGSVFKIITLAAALQSGEAEPSDSYPAETAATLSGVRLANAGGGSCGGSLAQSFAESCNSVFAPMGVDVGPKRLVRTAERFGFNEPLRVPAAETPTLSPPDELTDDLALGSAAIGQERDLATPLAMASVGATIANDGVRVAPRIVRQERQRRRRVVPRRVARIVNDMMIGVVTGGTGTAAAVPGTTVAGKTGTAELVSAGAGESQPENETGWFVGFAPASDADVAVAVMVVGEGGGGSSAAPIAKTVLQAAL